MNFKKVLHPPQSRTEGRLLYSLNPPFYENLDLFSMGHDSEQSSAGTRIRRLVLALSFTHVRMHVRVRCGPEPMDDSFNVTMDRKM